MSTVLRYRGVRVMIHLPTREHGPAHGHVWKAGRQVVIRLDPVTVRRIERMPAGDVAAAVHLVEANLDYLLEEWRRRHG